jgi:hypothetical protein
MTMGSLCGRRSHCCQDDGRGGTANPSIDDNVLRTAIMMAIDAIVVYVNVFLIFFMSVGVFFFIVADIVIIVALTIITVISPYYLHPNKFSPFQDQADNRSS